MNQARWNFFVLLLHLDEMSGHTFAEEMKRNHEDLRELGGGSIQEILEII